MLKTVQTYKTLEELTSALKARYIFFRYTSHETITSMGLRYWNGDALCPKFLPYIAGDMVTLVAEGIGDTGLLTRTIDAKETKFVSVESADGSIGYYVYDETAMEWKPKRSHSFGPNAF